MPRNVPGQMQPQAARSRREAFRFLIFPWCLATPLPDRIRRAVKAAAARRAVARSASLDSPTRSGTLACKHQWQSALSSGTHRPARLCRSSASGEIRCRRRIGYWAIPAESRTSIRPGAAMAIGRRPRNHHHMPIPSPRCRPSSHEMPSPRTRPETCLPSAFSMTGRQGTRVNSRDRSTKAYFPLTSCTDCR